MILEQFDKCKDSTFNPEEVVKKIDNFPKIGVSFFSHKLMSSIVDTFKPEIIGYMGTANGKLPIYKIAYKGIDVAIFLSRVGASACAVGYEEVIAMGLEKLILYGTCGVLDKSINDLSIIIPNSAIRDEGTSYHYKEASDEISVNEKYIDEFIDILKEHNYSYTIGKTWTTDALYRETREKVKLRKEQGCVCVEMECSALSAVSKFRDKEFFQFFYAADNLDGSKWDRRSLGNNDKLNEKEKLIYLALELALVMNKQ